ncbi:hypothetical protein [Aridibaculum aurantiacum]|uniref:hypothetical protein n=1 Tax=Aridibaculum aurantiacum TaxID=2810307 RepID=UPI001A9757C8|nr:hypothetical protein [Aridibaculum aurantiacum]
MRIFILLAITAFTISFSSSAQLPQASFKELKKMEDSMKLHSRNMIWDADASRRFNADSIFIRSLVRSLRVPHSFHYPFDSLITVSKLYPADSSFRIFSWQFNKDDNYFRQRGAIQMRTADGSLKLFPLLDMSEFTNKPEDSVRSARNWIGAIYYGIVMKTHNNKNYYTLLGFDDNNLRSTKKWVEVLTFNDKGEPVFGGPYFNVPAQYEKEALAKERFVLEYKKDGRARMNYDSEMDLIIFDHLISETNENDKKYTFIPDGDYQGFKWNNGKWEYVDKVFDFKLKDGEAPMPAPLKDDKGNSNEQWLMQQSETNQQKGKTKPVQQPAKKAPPKKEVNRRSQDIEEY